MHEVDVPLFQPLKNRARRIRILELVPAHMRHFIGAAFEPDYPAGQNAKALVIAVLLAPVEEELHAETDAEQRLTAGSHLAHHNIQPALAKMVHRIAEGANARQ
ncbi:hypothetical protein D3C85_1575050 [compost metagenome]